MPICICLHISICILYICWLLTVLLDAPRHLTVPSVNKDSGVGTARRQEEDEEEVTDEVPVRTRLALGMLHRPSVRLLLNSPRNVGRNFTGYGCCCMSGSLYPLRLVQINRERTGMYPKGPVCRLYQDYLEQ